MNLREKQKAIEKIQREILNLKKSTLYRYRIENGYQPVVGEGSLNARIMFVGEAPGRREAESGRPFAGAAGKVLDGLLASIQLSRKSVYITNLVNDRPPANRDPLPVEVKLYASFLDRQIDIIKPRVIATLGRHSMRYILEKFGMKVMPIGKIHGKVFEVKTSHRWIKIIPLYHPASVLYGNGLRRVLRKDFQILKYLK
ncbi:uracil-DNA glycosylase [Candidatus Wolfebacteria bacterium]|nr:uracil-DNA glycosylase [Candidatus Wolfebacteria bacterium]